MARVLAISSQVARGHVGLAAIVPALQRLGHEVVALPTVLLSNHPGHAKVAGERVSPELMQRMIEALEANGWLAEIDAVITGYLPSAAHVRFASAAVDRVRKHRYDALVLVDPVLGDVPKGLYIDAAAAVLIRDELLPLAHIVTPNAFELGWLTGAAIAGTEQARAAAARLGSAWILVTSVPTAGGDLDNILVQGAAGAAFACAARRRNAVPNGTGDLLAALLLGHALRLGTSLVPDAFALALAGLHAVIDASVGRDELQLAQLQNTWSNPAPLPLRSL